MTTEALLVMDIQNGVVDQLGEQSAPFLATLADAVAAARAAKVPVIFVRVAFRAGTPEISPKNLAFSAYLGSDAFGETVPATQIPHAVAAQSGEVVVTKKRVSAFSGSDLQVVLRSLGVDSLVFTGIATSGVVLSTLREAADLDYALTVLRDCCLDRDEEVHRVLLDKVFPRQAAVVFAADWIARISANKNRDTW
jgi:nicotinamidase-related amidase